MATYAWMQPHEEMKPHQPMQPGDDYSDHNSDIEEQAPRRVACIGGAM